MTSSALTSSAVTSCAAKDLVAFLYLLRFHFGVQDSVNNWENAEKLTGMIKKKIVGWTRKKMNRNYDEMKSGTTAMEVV